MRRLDDDIIDPEVEAALDAIDATLAGDPVDPKHAELAELALLLAAGRPEVEPEFGRSLDQRVARRFAPAPASDSGSGSGARRWRTWEGWWGVAAAGLAAVVAVVVVVNLGGGHGQSASEVLPTRGAAAAGAGAATTRDLAIPPRPAPSTGGAAATSAAAPQPPGNGRKVVQSAQLALTAPASRIEDVAQEAFDAIGRENGIVRSSSVAATGGPDGYAQFQLSVPNAALPDTMAALSRLRFAHVASRTDTSQDVNDTFVSVTRSLADARALRTALLRQLAGATTQQQIDSLKTRIGEAETTIAGYEARLRSLNRQVNYSQISLTINAGAVPVAPSSGGSFTLGKALHDAGRVLTVAAGVALIALAALVPVALIAALIWWLATAVRRRRREQALDLA